MDFQEIIEKLNKYWASKGCLIVQPYDVEVGAGTFHPLTFFRALDEKPWRVAFVQPSRRPTDGRYADNPLRTQRYYQYQVVIKPAPDDIQKLYLESLENLGIKLKDYDVRFIEDDWESPTLGATGLGWEVWLDSLEVTQFTYFQQIATLDLKTISVELTYGLERIAMFIQGTFDLFKLSWNKNVSYGDIHRQDEVQFSKYNFENSDIKTYLDSFEAYEKESKKLIKEKLFLPAYDIMLKTSHIFNMLDARGVLSPLERQSYIARVRNLARGCAEGYLEYKEKG
ncbi:MAG: glycine--tRNA ligase subunit alpha [Candidatus Omnitrophica bacterium]|nr:glycine--tRNA ligase subunit alpha [Candidatus Omnitrophota bacterium]